MIGPRVMQYKDESVAMTPFDGVVGPLLNSVDTQLTGFQRSLVPRLQHFDESAYHRFSAQLKSSPWQFMLSINHVVMI